MKLRLLLILVLCITFNASGQEPKALGKEKFFKSLYTDFLKYGTIYASGDISNSIEAAEQKFVLRTNDDGSIYSIPRIENSTEKFSYDYRYSIGLRKLARFSYERKPKNFYDGNESQLVYAAPTSAIQGLEYQIHFEQERWRGVNFNNHRVFLKHTGKYHIAKLESRAVGKINLDYKSAELRGRLPIGKKFSISAGIVARGHDRAYGYNPFEIWLNEMAPDEYGTPYYTNQWYTLGFEYGYSDHFTSSTTDGVTTTDWIWKDIDGSIVANTDLEFREEVFPSIINRYNREAWDVLDTFIEIAPIIGFDFYHYKNKFWLHTFGNLILPNHKYIKGDGDYSYMNRDNWGPGGLRIDSEPSQWTDFSFGTAIGIKVTKNFGVFMEGEYAKNWDSRLFQTSFGINFSFN